MIVDSSALIAIILAESHGPDMRTAIFDAATVVIPASVLTEIQLATGGRYPKHLVAADELVALLLDGGAEIAPFTHLHAEITRSARTRFGKGNGSGGLLNFGDLMVYAVAKERNEPLLCTGRDFFATDLQLHPASRLAAADQGRGDGLGEPA